MQFILKILLLSALIAACTPSNKPTPAGPADAGTLLQHKYWVNKSFYDAVFASNVADTLSYLPCSELLFTNKDTLLFTSCLSDAGMGIYKVSGPNTLRLSLEGFDKDTFTLQYDPKTNILHLDGHFDSDTWPREFVPVDGIDVSKIDEVTIQLGRKRLAGKYTRIAQKGQMVAEALVELHEDGTQIGLGNFDTYEPWPSGEGGSFINSPSRNMIYFVKKGNENNPQALAWQVRGDTLRIWETKNTAPEGDMPEYKTGKLYGEYVKAK